MSRLEPGLLLGERYRLEARVASGGMADVWSAEDDVLQRRVALKVMRPDPDHEELFALRFRDEALHSAALIHTNIATLFDYGEDQGFAFLVMELVDGKPLSQLIRDHRSLPADQVRSVIGQCALALGVAHEAKVVHRDVKPANILVREDGLVKLTDFGIARAADASGHTRAGDLLGTPSYISPEQALGRPATGASDLYALGIVGHEMLCGAKPFDKPTPDRHRDEPHPRGAAAPARRRTGGPGRRDRAPAGEGPQGPPRERPSRRDPSRPRRPRDHRPGPRPRPGRVRRVDARRRSSSDPRDRSQEPTATMAVDAAILLED